eukprot:349637-Chlamydomonas_euryale.AAC.5
MLNVVYGVIIQSSSSKFKSCGTRVPGAAGSGLTSVWETAPPNARCMPATTLDAWLTTLSAVRESRGSSSLGAFYQFKYQKGIQGPRVHKLFNGSRS